MASVKHFRMTTLKAAVLTPALLAQGVEELVRREPCFGQIVGRSSMPSLRAAEPGAGTLLNIVTEQFLSLKAAHVIWLRLEARLAPFSSAAILACPVEELMRLGLSGAKARSFHAIALQLVQSPHYLDGLSERDDSAARKQLMALPGVGPWTAEIYLLTALQRPDAWPWNDLALRQAAADLFRWEDLPDAKTMQSLGQRFSPWRSVAARLLWSHYRSMKGLAQAT